MGLEKRAPDLGMLNWHPGIIKTFKIYMHSKKIYLNNNLLNEAKFWKFSGFQGKLTKFPKNWEHRRPTWPDDLKLLVTSQFPKKVSIQITLFQRLQKRK